MKIGFAGGYLLSGEGSAGRGSGGPEAVAGRAVDGGGCGGGCHIPEKYKIPYSVVPKYLLFQYIVNEKSMISGH